MLATPGTRRRATLQEMLKMGKSNLAGTTEKNVQFKFKAHTASRDRITQLRIALSGDDSSADYSIK